MSGHHDGDARGSTADPDPAPSGPNTPAAQVSVGQTPVAWDLLASAARHYVGCGEYKDKIAALVAEIMPAFLYAADFSKYFHVWEAGGFHVTPVHFYSPIPNAAELSADIWTKETAMVGIDMNERGQLRLLTEFKRFQDEYNVLRQEPADAPDRFYLRNPMFGGADALVLYCMVRHFQPCSVIEVGSGFSTRLFIEAAQRTGPMTIRCIDPYPDPVLKRLPVIVVEQRVQDVSLSIFDSLESGDFLFIDSSHVLRIGGDVSHLLLEILPKLKPGVIVHFHDIFLPRQPPKEWVLERLRFWCEQDFLQAFLAFNGAFQVLLSNSYLHLRHEAVLREVFPRSDWWDGGSFWIRRV